MQKVKTFVVGVALVPVCLTVIVAAVVINLVAGGFDE